METSTRNATLQDLASMLQDQQGRKLDVVASATAIRSEGGLLVVEGSEPEITEEGVTQSDGRYRPTDVCDGGISAKLGIPVQYLKRMRADAPDLYDANVNGWLHGRYWPATPDPDSELIADRPADHRKFLLRCFRGDDGGEGIARAFMSDSYKIIDNLDALTAALDGVKQAGVPIEIDGCDLTDRRMYVRVTCEQVRALAPVLLEGYRSPYGGGTGTENPVVFGGFVISNSEVGQGGFTVTPRLVVQVCRNGMTMTRDALSQYHIGSKMEEGVIRWSEDTRQKNLELVTAQARDAVAAFLDTGYIEAKIRELEGKAGAAVREPEKVVQEVAKQLAFSEEQTNSVLAHFIQGGQLTAGGVMQAVTAAAQGHEDADAAFDMEAAGLRAMEVAASLS